MKQREPCANMRSGLGLVMVMLISLKHISSSLITYSRARGTELGLPCSLSALGAFTCFGDSRRLCGGAQQLMLEGRSSLSCVESPLEQPPLRSLVGWWREDRGARKGTRLIPDDLPFGGCWTAPEKVKTQPKGLVFATEARRFSELNWRCFKLTL